MDAATEGAGGGGGGSLLTGNNAGGGNNAAQGQQNNQSQANQGGGDAGAANGGGGAQGNQAANWRSALPTELQTDPSIQMFNDIPALVKSYIHAQKTVGADKIVIPGKHATEQDWQGVYERLGLPKDIKDYEIKLAESASIDQEFTDSFRAAAHKAGVLPQQAQKLADWFSEVNAKAETDIANEQKAQHEADIAALKNEWGAAFDKNLRYAGQVIRENADPEMVKYLDESGLGNDVRLIKLLSSVAQKYMKEDQAIGGAQGMAGTLSPKDALVAANKILADFSHPYHDAQHPNHAAAVAEVKNFFEMANPKKSG